MKTHSAQNERIKRAYIDFLRQAMGRSEASLEAVAAALHRFESYTRFRDFHDFHIEQAKAFKSHLAKESNARTGEKLSAATITSTLGTLKAFFRWLAGQPGYKSRIDASDAEYFNPPTKCEWRPQGESSGYQPSNRSSTCLPPCQRKPTSRNATVP